MAFRLECPHCARRLEADDESIGAITGCPTCQKDFVIERPRVQLAAETASDFITLACPSCSGQLEITTDIERFCCVHCGREHIVKRKGGVISLSPMVQAIRQVQAGIDKTASELAIVRIKEEIVAFELQKQNLPHIPRTHSPAVAVRNWSALSISLMCFIGLAISGRLPHAFIVSVLGTVMYFSSFPGLQPDAEGIARLDEIIDSKMGDLEQHHRQVSQGK